MKQVIGYTSTQPHTSYGNEKSVRPDAPRIPYGLNDAPEDQTMRQISFDSIYPNPENLASFCLIDPPVDFDTPAGRTPADRLILALRPSPRPDAVPLGSVRKDIAGQVWWLVVYEDDVLAGLLRMGWTEGGAT